MCFLMYLFLFFNLILKFKALFVEKAYCVSTIDIMKILVPEFLDIKCTLNSKNICSIAKSSI